MSGPALPLPPILRLSRALHGAADLTQILDRVRDFLVETTRYRWVYAPASHQRFEWARIYDSTSACAPPRLVATARDGHIVKVGDTCAWLDTALER
jgi:hypothetical protein